MKFTIELIGDGVNRSAVPEEFRMVDPDRLTVDIIGDSGPFSQLGKSIGYRLTAGDCQFLIDCGAPVFQLLGADGLNEIEGIIGTHAHEDHKRWFTDIALYQKFSTEEGYKIDLFGSHEVIDDYRLASVAALERTLTPDSTRIANFSFHDYVNTHPIAPEPRYQLRRTETGTEGKSWRVVDRDGQVLPPDRARVFTEEGIHRPRMLLKDPEIDRWVEPASFYSFDDERFYNVEDYQPYSLSNGLTVKPIKATAWHGPSTNSLLFEFDGEQIFFSSDTIYDPALWDNLAQPVDAEKDIGHDTDGTYVVDDDINAYVEQVWSTRRKQRALRQYEQDYTMIHDVTGPWATVHTDYRNLESREDTLLLTHSPDVFTTVHPLAHLKKTFTVKDNELYEVTDDGNVYPMLADCYHKEFSRYYVGFEDDEGDHLLLRKGPGEYDVKLEEEVDPTDNGEYDIVTHISLYEEINGEYFPYLPNDNEEYIVRPDGQVEHVVHNDQSSKGEVVKGKRSQLTNENNTSRTPTTDVT